MSDRDLIGKLYEALYTDGTGIQHRKTWTLIALDDGGFVVFEDAASDQYILIPRRRIDQLTQVRE